jgi:hypothetical protein
MSSFESMTRDLTFRWRPNKLTQDVNLMLAFEPPKDTILSATQNMVAWKSLKLSACPNANNLSFFTVKYPAKYAFGASVLDGGNVGVTNILPIELGETTNLKSTDQGCNPLFTEPTKAGGESKLFQATNTTESKQWISIGTINEDEVYSPTFCWKVGKTMTVQADLHPVLMGFVNLGYKQSQLITADITNKAMWKENLVKLPTNTTWEIRENPSGDYIIDRIN